MAKAPVKQSFVIDGPAGSLEVLVEVPENSQGDWVAVLCHPHPQFEGTMHNKVVHALARAVNDLGIPALRFNFRGVGASAGDYADGEGELQDCLAVVDYAEQSFPGAQLILAGFSFGAVVAARAAVSAGPRALVSIAPAVNILGRELRAIPEMPWLIVQGDADDVVPPDDVADWVATLTPAPELVMLPDVGHFFHGSLVDLRTIVGDFLRTTID